jgi:hypothetical protein
MTGFVPPALTGLWQRDVMIRPDGSRDETTRVFWLQTRRLFADIRVPADRPPAAEGFAGADLLALARMQGFGGVFEVEGDFCRWRREIDYQPPNDEADEATCFFEGEILVEVGVHAPYREDWRRLTPADAPLASWRLEQDDRVPGRAGILVVAGDRFILIEDRADKLPPAASLAALVAEDLARGARDAALERLGMRIALGHVAAGAWRVTLSTLPWLEGASPFGAGGVILDPADGGLVALDQRWSLVDATLPPDRLAPLLSAAGF